MNFQLNQLDLSDKQHEFTILTLGTFNGIKITEKTLSKIVTAFNERQSKGFEPSIQANHGRVDGSLEAAYGWVKSARLSEDKKSVIVSVEFNENGIELIKDKKYKYLSIGVNQDSKGLYFRELSFTNDPAIKEGISVLFNQQKNIMNEDNKELVLELTNKVESKEKEILKLNTKIEASQQELLKANEKIETLEKEIKFSELVAENKAVPASKEAFMSNDILKFAELNKVTQQLNFQAKGKSGNGQDQLTSQEAEEKLIKLANELKDSKGIQFAEAHIQVCKENDDLVKLMTEGA